MSQVSIAITIRYSECKSYRLSLNIFRGHIVDFQVSSLHNRVESIDAEKLPSHAVN